MDNSAKDILLDELESFDPKYQKNYKSLESAAMAAGQCAVNAYLDFLDTFEGQRLADSLQGIPDYQAENDRRKQERLAELRMANRGRSEGVC